ncbi:hypothetical protein O181_090328 [Austropuccinia psidii MF-1]|uniref:Uncharacterized protein n=1 Tax=Austropuccinia psidii MF-1 TaxID=1389203 RepID=A0A9Q3IUV2_9BASI|nr:hypothetical protein [Austropuccinia psidii MF-1]
MTFWLQSPSWTEYCHVFDVSWTVVDKSLPIRSSAPVLRSLCKALAREVPSNLRISQNIPASSRSNRQGFSPEQFPGISCFDVALHFSLDCFSAVGSPKSLSALSETEGAVAESLHARTLLRQIPSIHHYSPLWIEAVMRPPASSPMGHGPQVSRPASLFATFFSSLARQKACALEKPGHGHSLWSTLSGLIPKRPFCSQAGRHSCLAIGCQQDQGNSGGSWTDIVRIPQRLTSEQLQTIPLRNSSSTEVKILTGPLFNPRLSIIFRTFSLTWWQYAL